MLLLFLLLLFLTIQPSQPNPAYRQTTTHPEDRDDNKPSEAARHHNVGGQKRQVFNFGTNTPKPSNASDYDTSSGSGNALPSSDTGSGSGQDLSSFLGNRLGVNRAGNSGISNTTEGVGSAGENGGGGGDLSGSSGNSSSVSNTTELETKSEESGGVKTNTHDPLTSVDKTTLPPTGQDESSSGGSGSEQPGTGNVLGNLLGALGAWENSTVNTTDSGQGGGGRLGLVNASDSEADSSSQGTLPCVGLNLCHPGYCHNGGTCFYNTTTCLVSCLCPPPFNDTVLFDQRFCTPLGTLPPWLSTSPATGDGEVTPGGVTPCSGLNMCHNGHECQHGGQCYYNTSTCRVRCLCPPPYNDSDLFDQLTCGLLPTTPPPSPSSLVTIATTTTSSGSTNTLRPLAERICRVRYCIHGYCDSAAGRCKCDPGWQGFFCDTACSRKCGENGRCMAFFNGTQVCNCFLPWTGDFCAELIPDPAKPEDGSLVYWLGGSFAVGLVVLVVVGALFMFCLWRKRLAFALRVVYYFLPYEDNDGRVYDAFVSYILEDADENFVHYDLRPKLENEMGFTLCLHQRDFPLGGTITDNILDGLENSRRFILVITPAYLRNEWAEFEFQRAFHEMLKRKISIIPIILEDISTYPEDSLNPTLKTIMESVTPLKYPGTTAEERKLLKFWKQVKLCMPKKKKVEEADTTALPVHGGAVAEVPDDLVRNNHQVLDGGRNNLPLDMDFLGLYPRIAGYSCEELIPNNERCAYRVADVSDVVLRRDDVDAEQSV